MRSKRTKYTNANMLYAAKLMAEHGYTIRKAAEFAGLPKSTLFLWIKKELFTVNSFLYYKVDEVMKKNFAERHLRGGMSTKKFYENKKLHNTAHIGWKIYG